MPDTTIINHIVIDSINLKLSAIQHALEKSPSISNNWIPFMAVIAGGILVWVGQAIERSIRKSIDKKNSMLEIYAYCRKLEAEMKNNYRELAMAKTHVEYWWHGYKYDGQDKQRCYEEHLKSQTFAREVEKNIGNTKAAYIGHVRKFQAIHSLDQSIEKHLEVIADLKNAKAKSYDNALSHNQVRYKHAETDEIELADTYYQNLNSFKEINDKLQRLVSKKSSKLW